MQPSPCHLYRKDPSTCPRCFRQLGTDFRGTVQIAGETAQTFFVAAALNGDGGVLSS